MMTPMLTISLLMMRTLMITLVMIVLMMTPMLTDTSVMMGTVHVGAKNKRLHSCADEGVKEGRAGRREMSGTVN